MPSADWTFGVSVGRPDAGHRVVYIGEGSDTSAPLLCAWMPEERAPAVEERAPTREMDGHTTARRGYPVGVIDEDGLAPFVVYTLSEVDYREPPDRVGQGADRPPAGTNTMSLRLYTVGVPW